MWQRMVSRAVWAMAALVILTASFTSALLAINPSLTFAADSDQFTYTWMQDGGGDTSCNGIHSRIKQVKTHFSNGIALSPETFVFTCSELHPDSDAGIADGGIGMLMNSGLARIRVLNLLGDKPIYGQNDKSAGFSYGSDFFPSIKVDNSFESRTITLFAKWQPSLGATCNGTPVDAVLVYNNETFSCHNLANDRTIVLYGTNGSQNCNPLNLFEQRDSIEIGDFQKNHYAEYTPAYTTGLGGFCNVNHAVGIIILNSYSEAANAAISNIGSGTWTSEQDPIAAVNVSFTSSITGHICKQAQAIVCDTETFTQTNISGNVITLKGTSKGDPSCQNDVLNIGSSLGVSYKDAQQGSITVYSHPTTGHLGRIDCQDETKAITISHSFIDTLGTTGGSVADSCPVHDTSGINFILCPIYSLASGTVTSLNGKIADILYVNTDQVFSPKSFQNSYNLFRNFALALLVIAALIMVLSEAAGVEAFAAYTVRKALPKIVVAAIGISLAWPLLQFAVTLSNDLGSGVSSIISSVSQRDQAATDGSVPLFSGLATTLLGAGVFTLLGVPGALAIIGLVALTFLIDYIVFVIRLLIIILCVLLAPLAIAASVLPGTEGIWKFWRNTLQTTLLVFPVVTGIIAAGTVISNVASGGAGGGGNGTASQALNLVAVIGPLASLALIPFSLQILGGPMAQIFGAAQKMGQGGFGFLKQQRNQAIGKNIKDIQSDNRFNQRWNRGLGRVLQGASTGPSTGFGLMRGLAKEKMAFQRGLGAEQAAQDPLTKLGLQDDDGRSAQFLSAGFDNPAIGDGLKTKMGQRLKSLHYDENSGIWEKGWDDNRVRSAVNKARALGINQNNYRAAIQAEGANKARSLGYGQKTLDVINEVLDEGANGNASVRQDHAGTFGYFARASGRSDLAGIITNGGASLKLNPNGKGRTTVADGWAVTGMRELTVSTDGAITQHAQDIAAKWASSDFDTKVDAAHRYIEMQSLLAQTDPATQKAVNEQLTAQGFDLSARGSMSVEDFLAAEINSQAAIGRVTGNVVNVQGAALSSEARVPDRIIYNGTTIPQQVVNNLQVGGNAAAQAAVQSPQGQAAIQAAGNQVVINAPQQAQAAAGQARAIANAGGLDQTQRNVNANAAAQAAAQQVLDNIPAQVVDAKNQTRDRIAQTARAPYESAAQAVQPPATGTQLTPQQAAALAQNQQAQQVAAQVQQAPPQN